MNDNVNDHPPCLVLSFAHIGVLECPAKVFRTPFHVVIITSFYHNILNHPDIGVIPASYGNCRCVYGHIASR